MKQFQFIKNFYHKWGIYFLIASFTFIYTAAATIRHSHFESFAFDLGIFDQAIWLYSRFKIPYSTIKEMIILGDHFTPSLAIFAPFYWLYDSVNMLLFLQAFIVCLGALPIFLLGKKYLKDTFLSLVISFSYLVYFGLQNALLFDFHEITIATGLIPWLIFLAERKKWFPYFLLTFFIIGLKEDVPIITASIGLFILFKYKEYKNGILTISLSIISFFLITKVLIPYFNPAGFHYAPKIPITPFEWWQTFTQPPVKIRTLIISFLPFAFLPLFGGWALVPIFFHFLEHFPGKDLIGRWDIYLHYRAPLAPFMATASIFGIFTLIKWLKTKFNEKVLKNLIASLILIATFFTQYFFHLPLNSLFKKTFYYKAPFIDDINFLIAKIPKKAALSTQNNIGSHVAHREKIYLFPKIENSDYVFLDLRGNQPPNNFFPYNYLNVKNAFFDLVKEKKFKIIEKRGEAVLLKRLRY